mmetsp:Transcript_107888/g.310879  ORF Transcript_107888/g.310879 Transcript_107888/m.310879 type:complete len:197 (-) Transcript_107888:146-736(-)
MALVVTSEPESTSNRMSQRLCAVFRSFHLYAFVVVFLEWVLFCTVVRKAADDQFKLPCLISVILCTYFAVVAALVSLWRCSRPENAQVADEVQVEDGTHASEHHKLPLPTVAAKQAYFERVCPAMQLTNSMCPDGECCVCLEPLTDGDTCRNLSCNHSFHAKCIDGWWIKHVRCMMKCPLCKQTCENPTMMQEESV